ncbi:MAG: LysM peptidoglycan-binding domain-containing protein [Saprospiraceae bacterium]|nr:LysM peptidoglycan-binding domain-containing protein [Saprospiraceae bacterium]
MKSSAVLLILLTLLMNMGRTQSKTQDHLDYISEYKDIAIREMQRAGIPASIKLAQAILESEAGKSDLARRANNHFGIKCNPEWDGKKFYKKDDDYDNKGKLIESCFRVYKDAESSFIAHSEFLHDPEKIERYGRLFRLDITDYRKWAKELKAAGYATAGDYDKKLISLIERYELHKYDQFYTEPDEIIASEESTNDAYMLNNDVKYVLALDNEPVAEIARRTFTSVSTLLNYNENLISSDQRLPKDVKVYLQPKRSSYRGKQTWHYVKQGETMLDISNQYAIKLNDLYERNLMPEDSQPAPNERIKLRGSKLTEIPKLISDLNTNHTAEPTLLFEEEEEVVAAKPVSTYPQRDTTASVTNTQNSLPVIIGGNKPEKPQQTTNETATPIDNTQNNAANIAVKPTTPTVAKPEVDEPKPDNNGENEDFFESGKPLEKPVSAAIFHTVAKGDTLWNIAQRYATTVVAVKKLNNLNSDSIQLGMKLQVR